jgi:hypothetical protein
MTTFIPKLARITTGRGAGRRSGIAPSDRARRTVNVETLAGLMPHLRRRLAIGTPFSDEALLASLVAIASHASHGERWSAAEASTLGQYLANSSKDRHRTLVTLLSLLPRP